jgi:hypothetical protein
VRVEGLEVLRRVDDHFVDIGRGDLDARRLTERGDGLGEGPARHPRRQALVDGIGVETLGQREL